MGDPPTCGACGGVKLDEVAGALVTKGSFKTCSCTGTGGRFLMKGAR